MLETLQRPASSAAPLIAVSGDDQAAKRANAAFYAELKDLLACAGVMERVLLNIEPGERPGSSMTRGLMVGKYDSAADAVQIFWQDPAQSQSPVRVQMLLKMENERSSKLHTVLRNALQPYMDAKRAGTIMQAPGASAGPAQKPEAKPVQKPDAKPASTAEPARKPDIQPPKPAQEATGVAPRILKAFRQRVEQHVNERGFASARACRKVLAEVLRVPEGSVDRMVDLLMKEGALAEGPDEDTFKVLGIEPKKEVVRKQNHPPHDPDEDVRAAKKRVRPVQDTELVERLDELEGQVAMLDPLRKSLAKLDERVRKLQEEDRPKILQDIKTCELAQDTLARLKAVDFDED